ncbi:DsbC family protein [Vogesella oryzae]|uniref:DsbC family protein n=1 Tax=Vogesella oryzae TaxID=1735285 RepID=UPI00158387C4|nr:DsbC family protein [Vogesella oryzae]
MKLRLPQLAIIPLCLSLLACTASAEETPASVLATFKSKFPQHEVTSVQPAPVAGLYEVVVKMKRGGREEYTVVYADAKVEHLLTGDLIDTKTRQSLTEQRLEDLNKISFDWNSLPLDKAIKEVRGKGERKLAVFSDPDCPFCKRLEQDALSKLDNVTIYTFLYPLAQLHPDAPRKATQIWCSKDRAATWTAVMRSGAKLPAGTANCSTPLAELAALGEKLGVAGTPALFFPNGQMISGAVPVETIEAAFKVKAK